MKRVLLVVNAFFFLISASCKQDIKSGEQNENSNLVGANNGQYINDKKNGEWLVTNNGIITGRDIYVKDTVVLSIKYSKDGKDVVYYQTFQNDDVKEQVVVNWKRYKDELFDLSNVDKSPQIKGEAIYRYYCSSCHGRVGEKIRFTNSSGIEGMLTAVKSPQHPIKFDNLDSMDIAYLKAFISDFK